DVGDSVSISVGKVSNGSQLFGRKQAVGDPDSHHEALQRLAFPVLAAGYACPVTLRVHTPPAEIGSKPLWRNGPEALACEASNLFEAFPRIFGALKALDPLCLGFFCDVCHSLFRPRLFCFGK